MKQEILELTGLTEDQFYEKYPTQKDFEKSYPGYIKKLGGSLPEAFNMTMPMDKFFSYGVPVPPTYHKMGGSLTEVPVFPQAQTEAQFFVPTYSNSNNAYKKGGDIVGGSYLEVHPEARNLGWSPTNYFMLQQGGMYTQDMNVPGTLPMLQQGSLQMGGNPQESENEPSFPVKKLREYMNRLKELAAIANQREQEKQLVNIQMQEMQGMPVAKYGGLQKFQGKEGSSQFGPRVEFVQQEEVKPTPNLGPVAEKAKRKEIAEKQIEAAQAAKQQAATNTSGQRRTTAATTTPPPAAVVTTSPVSSTTGTGTTTVSTPSTTTTGTTTDGNATTNTERYRIVKTAYGDAVIDNQTNQAYFSGFPGQQQQQQTGYGYPYYSPFGFRDQRGTYNLIDLFPGQKTRWRDIIGFDQLTPEQLEAIRSGLANVADFDYETKRRGLLQKIGFGKPDVTRVNVKFRMPGSSPTSVPQIKDPGTAPVSTTPAVQTQDSELSTDQKVQQAYNWNFRPGQPPYVPEIGPEGPVLLPGRYIGGNSTPPNTTEQKRRGGPYALPFFQFGGDDPLQEEFNVGLDIGKEKSFDPLFAAKVQMAADVKNNMGETARSRQFSAQMSGADPNFAAMSPFRGDYVVNTPVSVDFRPDQMVTRYGGSYAQYGGAQEDFIVSGDNYYLTPQMLKKVQRFIGR